MERKGKKYFKRHRYSHLQANCPNRKTLTPREVEEIQALEEETSNEEFENEYHTLVSSDY